MFSTPRQSPFARRHISPFVLVALCLLYPSALFAARPLSGTVRDAATLLPVPFATIELRETGRVTEADADGRFAFDALPNGEYHLCIQRIGYRRLCGVTVQLAAEELVLPVVLLQPEPLSGTALEVRTRRETVAPRTSPSRIVITPEQVRQSGGVTAADVLERQGGVEIVRQGAEAQVSIRGSRPDAVQVTLDGTSINPTGGAADLASIPASSIESIEVVQGPAVAAGGVDALAGAVLIRTRPPSAQRTMSANAGVGSFAARSSGFQLDGLGVQAQRFRLGWQNDLTDGSFTYDDPQLGEETERINNDAHRQTFTAQGAGALPGTWRWAGSASYYRQHSGIPGPEYQLSPQAGRRERRYVYTGRLEHTDRRGDLHFNYSHTRDLNEYVNSGVLPYRSETEALLHSARAAFTLNQGPARGTGASLEYIHEHVAGTDLLNPIYSFGDARRTHYAAALRFARTFDLGPSHLREFGIHLAARYDRSETEGHHPQAPGQVAIDSARRVWSTVNPQAQVTLAGVVSPLSWSVFAGYSSAFRRPSLLEQSPQEAYRTRGNPALLPERARQFETGYGLVHEGALRVSWQQQFYFARYHDLIYWQLVAQGPVFSPANIGRAEIDGREEELVISGWGRRIEVSLRHQFQDHRNTAGEPNTDGKPLPFRYRHKTQLSVSSHIAWGHVELARRWYDRRYMREAATKSLDPYAVTDLTAGLQRAVGAVRADLTFSIFNLGNTAYETVEREPMPGRSYHLDVHLEI